MDKTVKIGWSEVSITPDKPIYLAGQFYERVSQYVETPITVTAMAIEASGDQAVICSVDIESVDPVLPAGVRANVAAANIGLDPAKIIFAATHSHTSFVYEGSHDSGLGALAKYLGTEESPENTAVVRDDVMSPAEATAFLIERLTEAVITAWTTRAPGAYAPGFGRAAVGMNRRVCYADGTAKMWGDTNTPDFTMLEGGNDNGIELLFTYDTDGALTGVVANIACPAQVMEQRYLISADYWGKVKILLRRELGEDLKVLGLCSPAGDQCPRDLVRWVEPETPIEDPNVIRVNPPIRRADPSMFDIKGTWTIGRRIASEILAVLEETEERFSTATLIHHAYTLDLPLRTVTEEENAAARAELAKFAAEHANDNIKASDSAAMHVYAGTAARYDRQQTESVVPCPVHFLRLGDIALATSPFELFLDFANLIRARSAAKQTFLLQLTDDSKGYLPTAKAEAGGHYSAYVSSGHVGHVGGLELAKITLDEIADMFAE
ncbi:MAG: hypothetical protein IJX53_01945 [Clostridia bacterium]|nr:hypothetical protein [Clostridia bacterium]